MFTIHPACGKQARGVSFPRAVRLADVLLYLPPPLRPLAIRADDPGVDRCCTLRIADMSVDAAAACAAAAVSGSLHLTAVILDNIIMALGHDAVLDLSSRSALRCAVHDIATLPKLASLTISGVALLSECSRPEKTTPSLLRLSGLTHLQISNCVSVGSKQCWVLNSLPGMTAICSLNLSRCGLSVGETAVAQHGSDLALLAASLRHLSALQLLSLAHNPLTTKGLRALMPSLTGLPLRSLVLRGCLLELGEGLVLGDAARDYGIGTALCTLSRLDISENDLSMPGHALGRGLLQLQRLKHLHLRDLQAATAAQLCLLSDLQTRQLGLVKLQISKVSKAQPVLEALQGCLSRWPLLHDLMLGFTQPLPLTSFVPGFTGGQKPLQQLQCLTLSRVSLCDDTVKLLIQGPELPALTNLTMKGVDGSRKGVHAFGTWLASCEALEVLVLETVQAGVWGGVVVAQSLRRLQRLQQLRWHGLRLGHASRGALASSLQELQRLQLVLVGGTDMSQQGWSDVMEVAGQLPELRVLGVSDEDMGKRAVQVLHRCLPGMTGLQQLLICNCGLNSQQRLDLTCILQPCTKYSIK